MIRINGHLALHSSLHPSLSIVFSPIIYYIVTQADYIEHWSICLTDPIDSLAFNCIASLDVNVIIRRPIFFKQGQRVNLNIGTLYFLSYYKLIGQGIHKFIICNLGHFDN